MRSVRSLILAGVCFAGIAEAQQVAKHNAKQNNEGCFYPGDMPLNLSNPTYNYPAAVDFPDQFGAFVDASYIYWYAGEGGLDVASVAVMQGGGNIIPPNTKAQILFPSFEYSSGFKLGFGWMPGVDHWVLRADYTYVRQKVNSNYSAPSQPNGTGVLYLTSWFAQSSSGANQALACKSLRSNWNLGIDWVDATLSRPHYMGRDWTVTPFGGLRSSWIRQSYHITLNTILNTAGPGELTSKNHSHSWGIGPRGGVEWHWLAPAHFRFQGTFGGSLLYTKYSTLSHVEDPLTVRTAPVSFYLENPTFLQAMAEASFGIGWCAYWGNSVRFDLSMEYDFNLLWNQNLIRTLQEDYILGMNPAGNNLFLHGLSVNIRTDF